MLEGRALQNAKIATRKIRNPHLSMDGTERAFLFPLIRAKRALALGGAEPPGFTDEQLLERVRDHDESSTLMLFRRYDKLAFSIGYKVLQDEGEAEDLTQEIFLRLGSEVNSFDSARGSARTWIIQMIYRRAFDRRAYLHRRQFYSGTDLQEQTNTLVRGRSPEDLMIDRLTVRQLKTAFSELSDRQRETLEMFFFEGLKFAEIAERTGENIKNVRHHYYRGLERLRQVAGQMIRTGGTGR
jgi:RNA polymerase sigma-70 factor, ECF subfamily